MSLKSSAFRPLSVLSILLFAFMAVASAQQEPTVIVTEDMGPPPALAPVAHKDELASTPFEALSAAQRREILDRVGANETAFREALNQYGFKREVVLQTVGPHGEITGQYIRTSKFILDDQGHRIEKILYHPKPTIHELRITKEDIQDLAGVQPFGFEASQLDKYTFALLGSEVVEGQRTYVISVTPRQTPDPHKMKERYFVGKIWVNAASYVITKMRGIAEPQGKQRFPVFETVRKQIDGSYWFPVETSADDILRFPGQSVHYRISVRYGDFKRFAGKVRIIEEGEPGAEVAETASDKPSSKVDSTGK